MLAEYFTGISETSYRVLCKSTTLQKVHILEKLLIDHIEFSKLLNKRAFIACVFCYTVKEWDRMFETKIKKLNVQHVARGLYKYA